MKVHTIEIAAAIEEELKKFLSEWGGGYPMRFTRFIDLGGRQTDLYVYTAVEGAPPWMIVRIKSVFKSEEGECIQSFVSMNGGEKNMEDVMVSPEIWKLPALADRILTFSRSEMLLKVQDGGAIEGGDASAEALGSSQPVLSEEDEEDLDDIDTSGILAADGDAASGDDVDPSDLIKQMNEASGDGEKPSE